MHFLVHIFIWWFLCKHIHMLQWVNQYFIGLWCLLGIFWMYSRILCYWHCSFQEKYFRSQNINLVPRRAFETLLLNISFDSKGDAAGDAAPSGYSRMSPTTVNMNLYGFDFSGRYLYTKFAYVTVRPFGTFSFMINSIVLFALTRLSIPLEILPSSFPTAFRQVLLSPPINKVSIVYFLTCLL